MDDIRERYRLSWLDDPIPMLNNVSPRTAARSAAGRARLDNLLEFYQKGSGGELDLNPDRAWVYAKLGLTSSPAEQPPPISQRACELAVGSRVVLTKLDTVSLNGQGAQVLGPLHDGRVPVRLDDGPEKRIRPRNLIAARNSGEHQYISMPQLPIPSAEGRSQSSHVRAYDKTVSYVIHRTDFKKLPRWPADGCERAAAAFRASRDRYQHNEFGSNKCRTQRAYEQVYGGWPSGSLLKDIPPDAQGFILALPSMEQEAAAAETFNPRAAIDHLYAQQSDPEVKALLVRTIGGRITLGESKELFPGLRLLLAALAKKGLATDRSLETLFGDAAHVRSLMLSVGMILAERPPPGSPAYDEWSDVLEAPFALLPGCCANCGIDDVTLRPCSGCGKAKYCSTTCQEDHWVVHRPTCLRTSGKAVPAGVDTAAASAAEQREATIERELNTQRQKLANLETAREEAVLDRFMSGEWKVQQLHDYEGRAHQADIAPYSTSVLSRCAQAVGLASQVDHLRPMLPIKGIPDHVSNIFLLRTVEDAYILVSHERLFLDHGQGHYAGAALSGMYVAVEGDLGDPDVTWVNVPRPRGAIFYRESACNAVKRWLEAAMVRATVVTHGIYQLGTSECLGHMESTSHLMGQTMRSVGPPTTGDHRHARTRALARQQLRYAQVILEAEVNLRDSQVPGAEAPRGMPSGDSVRAEAQLLSVLGLMRSLPPHDRSTDSQSLIVEAALLLAKTTGRRPSTAAVAAAALEQMIALDGWDDREQLARIKNALETVKQLVPVTRSAEEPRKCKSCGKSKPRDAFTANQWKQGKRRCLDCQGSGVTTTVDDRAKADAEAEEAAAFAAIHAQRMKEENDRVQAELERRNALERDDSECPICFDEVEDPAQRCTMHDENSKHWMCSSCLKEMLTIAQREDQTAIDCPHCRRKCSCDSLAASLCS